MKFFKYLALLALASVPLLMVQKNAVKVPAGADSDDDIFERDLRVE